ncbi:MAG: prevent-host-death family protein [Rhodocyclaceae bacterium]|nr:MAG: prevent-host-death family protein [Rhodocyclaceae bacterium]TNC98510.1 MAG: prevent-host-death family protein [Rhodocyclaceae bacterium]
MARIVLTDASPLIGLPRVDGLTRLRALFGEASSCYLLEGGMAHISANELKTKGVAAIEATLVDHTEAVISVRGKDRFVVMDIAHYHYLRECELDAALAESRADLAAGRSLAESPEAHLARLDKLT